MFVEGKDQELEGKGEERANGAVWLDVRKSVSAVQIQIQSF